MRKINRIKIYHNDNDKSNEILKLLTEKLIVNNFSIVEDNADLIIAIGGDGSFLRMVKHENYNSDIIYVGINAGTLGFLQEIKTTELDNFISCLGCNDYEVEEVGVQETNVLTKDNEFKFYSLNEIVVRERDLNTAFYKVSVEDYFLENYVGDGLLISTSIGSTAYNLSFGGSIISNNFHTLQITPIAPLNSKAYRCLLNSVITKERSNIKLEPINDKNNVLISIDGENKVIDDVLSITTKVENKRLKFFHLKDYSYWNKVNDKFLSN